MLHLSHRRAVLMAAIALLPAALPATAANDTHHLGMTFVTVPGGQVMLGGPVDDPLARSNERPTRAVTLAPFQMATAPVTVAQFNAFRTAVPSFQDPTFAIRNRGGDDRPAAVSWRDAQAFIAWVNLTKPAGDRAVYRLPGEAEWEHAARGGTTARYWWGRDMEPGRANCAGCGSPWDGREPAPAGSFGPGPFGLYDMAGNIWQWMEDCWSDGHADAPADGRPVAKAECSRRVLKGGTWKNPPDQVRPAARVAMPETHRSSNDGFRLVRVPAD